MKATAYNELLLTLTTTLSQKMKQPLWPYLRNSHYYLFAVEHLLCLIMYLFDYFGSQKYNIYSPFQCVNENYVQKLINRMLKFYLEVNKSDYFYKAKI